MTGEELSTFCEEANGGEAINDTFLFQLTNISKALVEGLREWVILRATDTSKTVTTGNTWQTAIDLSTITRFNRFYGDYPIRLFDGTNRLEYYRQVPFEERLVYYQVPNTFCYDEANKTLYLNGTVNLAGTLYINHIKDTADVTSASSPVWSFPSWSHPLLGLMAVAMNKGGVDYDDINARMSPVQSAQADAIVKRLEAWDTAKQIAIRDQYDPTHSPTGGFRPGAINME